MHLLKIISAVSSEHGVPRHPGRGGNREEGVSLGLNAPFRGRRTSCSTVCSERSYQSSYSSGYSDTESSTSDNDTDTEASDADEQSDTGEDDDDDDDSNPGWPGEGPPRGPNPRPGAASGRGSGSPKDSPSPGGARGCHVPYEVLSIGPASSPAPAKNACTMSMYIREYKRLAIAAAASLGGTAPDSGRSLRSMSSPPVFSGVSAAQAFDPEPERSTPQQDLL